MNTTNICPILLEYIRFHKYELISVYMYSSGNGSGCAVVKRWGQYRFVQKRLNGTIAKTRAYLTINSLFDYEDDLYNDFYYHTLQVMKNKKFHKNLRKALR